MKKLLIAMAFAVASAGCVSLSYVEKRELRELKAKGIDVDHGAGGFDAPNSIAAAGLLNVLPGFGNFYLAIGRGNDSVQGVYGIVNLLLWPYSIIWGAPQAAIDAHTLNQRELLYFYHYEMSAKDKAELQPESEKEHKASGEESDTAPGERRTESRKEDGTPAVRVASCSGTGWFVNNKCVATCWHVVRNAKKVKVAFSDGSQLQAKVVAKDKANDVAVLEVEKPCEWLQPLSIRAQGVKPSDKVFTVGYPLTTLLGQEQKYTEGCVSAISGIDGDGRCFQISVPIQPGNSGGALVDESGCVIGLTSASLDEIKTAQATGTLPQNVNYAIKARYLVAILDDAGIPYVAQDGSGVATDKDSAVKNAMKATCMVIAE